MNANKPSREGENMRERFHISPHAVAKEMGNSVVLVHLGTEKIFELNATAARIWDLLAEGLTREDILSRISEEFDVPREVAAQEIQELLSSLISENMISVSNE
jgi:coenzyme PQQ synthesis protein D (PqqD)